MIFLFFVSSVPFWGYLDFGFWILDFGLVFEDCFFSPKKAQKGAKTTAGNDFYFLCFL